MGSQLSNLGNSTKSIASRNVRRFKTEHIYPIVILTFSMDVDRVRGTSVSIVAEGYRFEVPAILQKVEDGVHKRDYVVVFVIEKRELEFDMLQEGLEAGEMGIGRYSVDNKSQYTL